MRMEAKPMKATTALLLVLLFTAIGLALVRWAPDLWELWLAL